MISAAPQEVIQSALEGIVPDDHIFGTRVSIRSRDGRNPIDRCACRRVTAKWRWSTNCAPRCRISHDRIVYVGDGSSDVHVMLHVNRLDGLTIAVSENKYITQIARRTILSDDALSVLVPVLEDIVGWDSARIRQFFEAHGFVLREWDKVRTDSLTIGRTTTAAASAI